MARVHEPRAGSVFSHDGRPCRAKSSPALLSGVGQDDGRGRGEQRDAERRGQAAAARQVLFYRHHSREREHPTKAPRSDDEHQQHQRPATADAEQAVIEAELEGLAAR